MSLPPREPPDLRNPANRRGSEPPQNNPYGQPQPPNWSNQQQPPGSWPPQQQPPQNNPYGQQPPNWPPQQQPPQYPPQYPQQPPPATGPLRGTSPLGPTQPPQLGGQQYYQGGIPPAQTPPLSNRGGFFQDALHERRIEYLAWGSVVIIMGFSIILLALDSEAAENILLMGAPLLSGMILMASGFIQRLFFGYNVSLGTWTMAVLGISFGCTRAIAEITNNTEPINQLIYFTGLLVIISGLIIILQVFRPTRH